MGKTKYLLGPRPTDRRLLTLRCPQCGQEWDQYVAPGTETPPPLPEGWVWTTAECGCKIAKHITCPMVN